MQCGKIRIPDNKYANVMWGGYKMFRIIQVKKERCRNARLSTDKISLPGLKKEGTSFSCSQKNSHLKLRSLLVECRL